MIRFTIRDVLWLTVVVGMGVAWYMQYQRLTRPPKLYRDEEISRIMHSRRLIVDDSVYPCRLVVPMGKSMPLSQVFKTLGIDPKRLTDFRYGGYNRVVFLSWQLSPTYDLNCTTDVDDGALAFDDPNRAIYIAEIQDREDRRGPPLPFSDKEERSSTTKGVEL